MKKTLRSNLSIVLAFFCLFSFFPFYAMGYISTESWPVPKDMPDLESGLSVKKAAVERAPEAPASPRNPLLDRFKPEEGWGPERREEIKLRTIRGGRPDAEERAFFLSYKEWAKALEAEKTGN